MNGGRVAPLPAALGALVACGYIGGAAAIGPGLVDVLLFLGTFAAFTAAGWPLARWILGNGHHRLPRAILAVFLGYISGALVFCLLRLAHVTIPLAALAIPIVIAWLLHRFLPRNAPAILPVPAFTRADHLALATLAGIVLLVVAPVFANIGKQTALGHAYRAYFTADLFAHMSVVAELAHRAIPPINPYLPTEPLPYYWAYFSLPAVLKGLRPNVLVDRGILQTDLAMALVLVGVWYVALRTLGASAKAAAWAWGIALAAPSFEGLSLLWVQYSRGRPLSDFRFINVDGFTRWRWDLPPVDSLHRIFWYTPQHATALTIGVLLIATVIAGRAAGPVRRGVLEALLLGAAMAISSFVALLLVAWYALTEITLLLLERGRGFTGWVIGRALAAATVVGALALTIGLGMVRLGTADNLYYKPNFHLAKGPLLFAILSFGPPLLFGVAGLFVLLRRRTLATAVVIMSAICVAFLELVEMQGHLNSYVPFRTGQMLFVLFAISTAVLIDTLHLRPRAVRWIAWTSVATVSIAGVPTMALDWYNARDIWNDRDTGFGFRWTTYVSDDELRAARWLRRNIDETETVNTDPEARGRGEWALIPAFGERRMGIGFGLFEPNPERFRPQMARIAEAFRTGDADAGWAILREARISFVFVGQPERDRYGDGVRKFATRPDRFQMVFSRGSVSIYRIVP
jgi:hypothetical protein